MIFYHKVNKHAQNLLFIVQYNGNMHNACACELKHAQYLAFFMYVVLIMHTDCAIKNLRIPDLLKLKGCG